MVSNDARLNELRPAQERYAALIEVARAVSGETDIFKLLALASERARELIHAEFATLYLVDTKKNELWSAVLEGPNQLRDIHLPIGNGIAGTVAKTGQVINLEDAYTDPRFDRSYDLVTGIRTRALLTVPMHSLHRGVMGVLQALNKRDGPFFDTQDVALVEAFAAITAVAVEAAELYQDLDRTFTSFVETMTATIDARDRQTAGHSRRVAVYGAAIARQMVLGSPVIDVVRLAGLVHDVGKISVPDAVLTKPGRLDDDERAAIQRHAAVTGDVLGRMYFFGLNQSLPTMAAQHHERPDGKGYPFGLKGEEISLGGRILGVADCFDALTHHRYYRNAMTYDEAYEYMKPLAESQFDPEPLKALGAALAEQDIVALAETGEPIATLSSDPSAGGTGD